MATTAIETPTTVSPAEEAAKAQATHRWRKVFSLENRYLPPMLITGILVVAQWGTSALESLDRTLLSIVTSILAELVLSLLVVGKWPHLASAYISGISVGILIRSPAYWPYALCSLISITSKYAIRWHGRHLWNPSNLGVSAMLFLAPATVASLSIQWDNRFWAIAVIWTLGTLIIARLRRFHICATYIASFVALSFVRSALTGRPWLAEVAPITGPMYQLFIFFMITDPRTTVRTKWGQCLVAFLVAFAEMILRLNEVVHAAYYALFLVGPAANAVEIWWNQRHKPVVATPAPAPVAAT